MGFLDDLKKAGSSVSEGASKMSQVQLQQHKLKSLKDDVATAQQEMGALVSDLIERGELTSAQLDAPQTRIKDALALVAAKEAEIATLKAD